MAARPLDRPFANAAELATAGYSTSCFRACYYYLPFTESSSSSWSSLSSLSCFYTYFLEAAARFLFPFGTSYSSCSSSTSISSSDCYYCNCYCFWFNAAAAAAFLLPARCAADRLGFTSYSRSSLLPVMSSSPSSAASGSRKFSSSSSSTSRCLCSRFSSVSYTTILLSVRFLRITSISARLFSIYSANRSQNCNCRGESEKSFASFSAYSAAAAISSSSIGAFAEPFDTAVAAVVAAIFAASKPSSFSSKSFVFF